MPVNNVRREEFFPAAQIFAGTFIFDGSRAIPHNSARGISSSSKTPFRLSRYFRGLSRQDRSEIAGIPGGVSPELPDLQVGEAAGCNNSGALKHKSYVKIS